MKIFKLYCFKYKKNIFGKKNLTIYIKNLFDTMPVLLDLIDSDY